MRFVHCLLAFFTLAFIKADDCIGPISNQCVQLTIGSGTGCAWMCSYCAEQLGTNRYYFTDSVCSFQEGEGCVGNPIAGNTYTCCTTSVDELIE